MKLTLIKDYEFLIENGNCYIGNFSNAIEEENSNTIFPSFPLDTLTLTLHLTLNFFPQLKSFLNIRIVYFFVIDRYPLGFLSWRAFILWYERN